ncbi:NlpC/P60 family protein [Maribacter sp. 2307UL18-2]|uniref:C40 family peptidase n=1 Tax=Maribacter sp. 2307UL18-2 TaxID=3386274 RepID=UPI0039BC9FB6
MQYGICHLSVVPVRSIADDTGEMVSQILYGEHFKVIESRKTWSKIRLAFDQCEGWVPNNQIVHMTQNDYDAIEAKEKRKYAADLISFVTSKESVLHPLVLGSSVHTADILGHRFEGSYFENEQDKSSLIQTALLYLNAPFLWGGRTPFGLDSSGFTQMTYKVNGYRLKRTALAQSGQGEALSFIEESEPGDLAFFDTKEGVIDHVGIVMENNYIIHCHGKVRIDRIDHTGIFNNEANRYTHTLRVIKKII